MTIYTVWVAPVSSDNSKLPRYPRPKAPRYFCDARAELPRWGIGECDRPRGHTGRHHMHDSEVIFAVWSD